ncbi:MAG: VWA domain-containing protein [Methylococcales bacterium]|nr:MAG: VWA domain-containing protein [Methylococcales bacterium]
MNMTEFHFIRPYWLMAIIPFVVIVILLLRNKLSRGNWASVCDAELLPYLLEEKATTQSRWPLTTGTLTTLLVIIALAGPTWKLLPSPAFRNESALVIALNLSRSMNAEDIKPTRLTKARYKISDILTQRKDGQTALLVYAGDAFTVTPLTDDSETIKSQLPALMTDIMPSEGNNTALALNKAVELFKQAGLQKGHILLVTDRVNNDEALNAASNLGNYPLSILGVGTDEGAPIALSEGGFLKDDQGHILIPKLNSDEMIKLSEAGKGHYQTITANDADIKNLLASIDQPVQQETKENKNILLEQWDDKGPWLLLLVLPLAALSFRKGLLAIALFMLLPLPKNSYALEWKDLWQTKDQQAQHAFNNNQFEQAAALFENPDWKAVAHYRKGDYENALKSLSNNQTALSAYNQGNALAQSGQLEAAIKAYDHALSLNPNDADVKYNKELVEKELEKQKQNQQDKQDKQDKQNKQDKQDKKDSKYDSSQKDSQQNKEGDKSEDKKPQQSEEKKSEQQQADEQKSEEEKAQQAKKEEEQKSEADKAQQAKQKPEKDKEDKEKSQPSPAEEQPSTEEQQANEQWLKRIPDDPAGLLKRKFKYQYSQRVNGQ